MQPHDEGRPGAALLLLCSMFAFALVFHALTKPDAALQARFDTQVAPLAHAIDAVVPAVLPAPPARISAQTDRIFAAIEQPAAATTVVTQPPAALDARAWPTLLMPIPTVVAAPSADDPTKNRGAVTRAFATTGTALRIAFRRTF